MKNKSQESKNRRTTSAQNKTVSSPLMLALEPRVLFDGALAATVTDAVVKHIQTTDHAAPASKDAAHTANATVNPLAQALAGHVPPATGDTAAVNIVFVDTSVKDWQMLAKAAKPGDKVVLLDPTKGNELDQIAAALKGQHNIASISILSHGNSGMLKLGDSIIDSANLGRYGQDLQVIKQAMGPNGDILLYGCDVGAGTAGRDFINSLAKDTGTVVAASTDLTGVDGDWTLEIATGTVDAAPALDTSALANYHYDLATFTVTSGGDTGAGTLRNAISTASSGDTINFSGVSTVTLSSGALSISKNLTIDGGTGVTINANYTSRDFSISAGATVTLDNLTIEHGLVSGNGGSAAAGDTSTANAAGGSGLGGAIYNAGTLTLSNDSVTANYASGGGGSSTGTSYFSAAFSATVTYGNLGGGGGGGVNGVGGGNGGGYNVGTIDSYIPATIKSTTGGTGGSGVGGGGGAVYCSALTTIHSNGFNGSAGGAGGTSYLYGVSSTPYAGGAGGNASAGGAGGASAGNAGGGAGGNGGFAGKIGGGGGGGCYTYGANTPFGGGSGGNAAGGIYNKGTLYIGNGVTLSGNQAAGGGGAGANASGNVGGNGGSAAGAIWNVGTLDYNSNTLTLSSNTADYGRAGQGAHSASAGNNGTSTNDIFNNGGSVNSSWTAAPGTPNMKAASDSGSSSTDNITNVTTPTFTGTGTNGDTVYLVVDGTRSTTDFATVSGGTWSITSSTLSSGSHSIAAEQSSDSGVTFSSTSSGLSVTIDTTAAAPTLSLASDTGSSSTDHITSNGTVNVSGLESGATWQYSTDSGATWTTGTGSSITLTGDGAKSVLVNQTDVAGNTSSNSTALNFTLDTTAPSAPTTAIGLTAGSDTGASSTDGITNDTSPTMQVNLAGTGAVAGDSVELLLGGSSLAHKTTATLTSTDITNGYVDMTVTAGDLGVDGSKTFTAQVTDIAGNVGTAGGSDTITLDTTAPTTTVSGIGISSDTAANGGTNSDFITKTASQTISGTLSASLAGGESLYGSVDGGTTWTDVTSKVSGTAISWTGATLVNGTHAIEFEVRDTAGNNGAIPNPQLYTLDTTPPAETISGIALSSDTAANGTTNTDFITKTASQTISGTLSGSLQVGESLYGSVDGGTTWTDITGKVGGTAISWTGATLGSGTSAIKFKVTDTAGNDGAVATQAYTLDTTAPATYISNIALSADTGTSSTDFITNTASQTISGALSTNLVSGESLYGSVDGGTTWTDVTSKVSGTAISWNGATLSGTSAIEFKVTDTAGNDGAVATQAYTLDTTAPANSFKNISFTNDTGTNPADFITQTAAQTITGSLSAVPASTDTVYGSMDSGATWIDITSKVTGQSMTWNGATLNVGSHNLELKVTDNAGNSSTPTTLAYILDKSKPTATSITASNMSTPTAPSFTITVNYADTGGAGFYWPSIGTNDISVTGPGTVGTLTVANAAYNSGTGVATYTVDAPIGGWTSADGGTYTIAINNKAVYDIAGNGIVGITNAATFNVIYPPTTSVSTAALSKDTGTSATDWITNTASQTVTGTLSASLITGEKVQVSLDGGTTWSDATGYSTGSSNWSDTGVTLSGSNTFEARVTNANGSSTAFTQAYTLDTTAPTAPAITAMSNDSGTSNTDGITTDTTPTLTGTAEANASVTISRGNTAVGTVTADGAGNWSFTSAALADGNYSFTAKATDTAGNTSTASAAKAVTVDTTAPNVALNTGLNVTQNGSAVFSSSDLQLSDIEGASSLTYTVGALPGKGALSLNGTALSAGSTFTQADIDNGLLAYKPTANQHGADSFTFTASDAAGNALATAQTVNLDIKVASGTPQLSSTGAPALPYEPGTLGGLPEGFTPSPNFVSDAAHGERDVLSRYAFGPDNAPSMVSDAATGRNSETDSFFGTGTTAPPKSGWTGVSELLDDFGDFGGMHLSPSPSSLHDAYRAIHPIHLGESTPAQDADHVSNVLSENPAHVIAPAARAQVRHNEHASVAINRGFAMQLASARDRQYTARTQLADALRAHLLPQKK